MAALIASGSALDKAPSRDAKRSRTSFPQLISIRKPLHDARLSHPQLRPAPRERRRRARASCRAGSTASATMAACCSSICAIITASPRSSPAPAASRSHILEHLRAESVVTIEGEVVVARRPRRPTRTCRPARSRWSPTASTVQSAAEELPLPVAGEADYPEDIRLRYRYLDLRRERLHANIVLRSQGDQLDPPADDRPGLHRVPDADPDRVQPRGRARLSGAEPRPSRQILRAAAGAADVQAADHGRRLRPLFPDRALLPRRGRPRRPLARRILPARFRNELRHAGRCFRSDRAGAGRRVRGIRQRQERDAGRRSSRAFPIGRRCSNTAPTSPICATRS